MGLSHGGLRQKAFNAYEETIHIPLVISNPVLFPERSETDAFASLDRPGADDRRDRRAPSSMGLTETGFGVATSRPSWRTRATPERRAPARGGGRLRCGRRTPLPRPVGSGGGPLHLRRPPASHGAPECSRDSPTGSEPSGRPKAGKFAIYFDPDGKAPTEYEMYDLGRDATSAAT